MASQTGPRVATSNSCKGQSVLEKGQMKILGPGRVIWDQIFEIWLQEGQHVNPGLKPFLTDHAIACGVNGLTKR